MVKGNDLTDRSKLDTAKFWTMIDFKNPVQTDGDIGSVSFFSKNDRPIRIGLYRPTSGLSFTCVKQFQVTPTVGVNQVDNILSSFGFTCKQKSKYAYIIKH